MTLVAYIQGIKDRTRDVDGKLAEREWEACLQEALSQYDADFPLEITATLTGDGTSSIDLPDAWQSDWTLLSIPELDDIQATYTVAGDAVVRTDGGVFVSGGAYTLIYRRPRSAADVSGIPSLHGTPVMDLAAAKACRRLAAIYMKSKDTSIGAEIINFQRKWDEHLKLADVYETQYSRALHRTEKLSDTGAIASGMINWSLSAYA